MQQAFLWVLRWTAWLHVEQMLYSKGVWFFFYFPLFFQWCFLRESQWNNSNSTPRCNLDSFCLHSKSERSPETSTANALKARQTIDGPPHFYTHCSTCVTKITFVCPSKTSNLRRPSVQTQFG